MSERSLAPSGSSVAPELVVTFDGADRTLRDAMYRVGRNPEADIVVTDLSRIHSLAFATGVGGQKRRF